MGSDISKLFEKILKSIKSIADNIHVHKNANISLHASKIIYEQVPKKTKIKQKIKAKNVPKNLTNQKIKLHISKKSSIPKIKIPQVSPQFTLTVGIIRSEFDEHWTECLALHTT